MEKRRKVVASIVFGVTFLLAALLSFLLINMIALTYAGATSGKVVDCTEYDASTAAEVYVPKYAVTVSYTVGNNTYTVIEKGFTQEVTAGTTRQVYYSINDPSKSILHKPTTTAVVPILLGLTGCGLIAYAILLHTDKIK